MRWTTAQLIYLTTAVAIAAVAYSKFWGPNSWERLDIALAGYLYLLTIASAVTLKGPPKWRRFSFAYALFCWSYLIFVLRGGYLLDWNPDANHPGFFGSILLGILGGFLSSFTMLILPESIERNA